MHRNLAWSQTTTKVRHHLQSPTLWAGKVTLNSCILHTSNGPLFEEMIEITILSSVEKRIFLHGREQHAVCQTERKHVEQKEVSFVDDPE